MGPQGPQGEGGPEGPKGSVILTASHGNRVVSVLESRRPRVFELVEVPLGGHVLLDAVFVECCVPGTLQIVGVCSLTPDFMVHAELLHDATGQVAVRTMVAEGELMTAGTFLPGFSRYAPVQNLARVMILGTHKHFPDWDLPEKPDEDRERSWNFWAQEWREPSHNVRGPSHNGSEGPVGMPGPVGLSHDGTPGETEEEHLQRWRDATEHNRRYYEKYPERAPANA